MPAREPTVLLADVRELILSARQQVAQTMNSGLTMLYWYIGSRIRKNILKEKRAEYVRQRRPPASVRLQELVDHARRPRERAQDADALARGDHSRVFVTQPLQAIHRVAPRRA